MSKIVVGICTFGNKEFTEITVNSIRETAKIPVDFFLVIGKPGDTETLEWANSEGIPCKVHETNRGFPASINDIYDYAWKENNYDYLILAGNDIAAYPYAIDQMITLADISDYECVNALQVDVRALVDANPEIAGMFYGPNMIFKRFDERPWDAFKDYSPVLSMDHMKLLDIQNLCLYKKSIMDKVGYTDVAFYPAYFVDNDYARRMVNAGVKSCCLASARFFHFWSRTLHQSSGGSNSGYFQNNSMYYQGKWGGAFGEETLLPNNLIDTRENEDMIIAYWKNGGKG